MLWQLPCAVYSKLLKDPEKQSSESLASFSCILAKSGNSLSERLKSNILHVMGKDQQCMSHSSQLEFSCSSNTQADNTSFLGGESVCNELTKRVWIGSNNWGNECTLGEFLIVCFLPCFLYNHSV